MITSAPQPLSWFGIVRLGLVQTALGAPARSFLDVNWRVRNCSISEFVFSRDRLSLDSFNTLPHLDPALHTYR